MKNCLKEILKGCFIGFFIVLCIYLINSFFNSDDNKEIDYIDSSISEIYIDNYKQTKKTDDNITSNVDYSYWININSNKFHCPTCHTIKNWNNYIGTNDSYEPLVNKGYSPCKVCNKNKPLR